MIKNKDLRNVVFLSFEFFGRKSVKARNLRFYEGSRTSGWVKDSVTKSQGIPLWINAKSWGQSLRKSIPRILKGSPGSLNVGSAARVFVSS